MNGIDIVEEETGERNAVLPVDAPECCREELNHSRNLQKQPSVGFPPFINFTLHKGEGRRVRESEKEKDGERVC